MPAFIDGHRHIMGRNFDQERVVRMQQFLDAGYTTLMEGGGRPPDIVDLKRQIADGELVGPRIITSGRADPGNFPDSRNGARPGAGARGCRRGHHQGTDRG